ncbi:MAG TPA: hybrid sensor histidine kinase/response regulator [Chitinophaga sp.]|uniref:ATP-binding response regulator n=1 Tax=Chitinophaga sp. TaxID=1869181 RepID=UPI002B65692A|nr:hybrid sensor histidine kinase/response regulator [Chitinophaga sp.]HVI47203.1 hybrid sensor histidine kinase/response regulator [Chitinophaga sp.]
MLTRIPLPAFVHNLLYAGTEQVTVAERKKAIYIINSAAALTIIMIVLVGGLLFVLTHSIPFLAGAIAECLSFYGVILLNRKGNYHGAAHATLLVHCFFALYFGCILGRAMPIEFITVFLLTFLIGGAYLIYKEMRVRIYAYALMLIVSALALLNNYLEFIQPIYFDPGDFLIARIACSIGMLILLSFVTFTVIQQNAVQKKEGEMLVDKLEASNTAKREFLASNSHEIRQPLNAVIGITQIVSGNKHRLSKEQILEYVDYLQDAALYLREGLNNTLDISKIEAGTASETPRIAPVNIYDCIRKSIAINQFIAYNKQLSVSLNYKSLPKFGLTDGVFLQKILNNLLSNAVKFAPANTEVTVGVSWIFTQLHISVLNNGYLKDEELKNIMEPYVSERNAVEGTGLGLSIVQTLLAQLGGRLVAHNVGYQIAFTASFPCEQYDLPVSENSEGDEIIENEFAHLALKAVIIEDDKISQSILRTYCETVGLGYEIASNGYDGLRQIERTRPDVVFSDITMPNMDGEEIIAAIKSTPEFGELPIIITTGHAISDTKEIYMKLGIAEYMVKPLMFSALSTAIRRHVLKQPN